MSNHNARYPSLHINATLSEDVGMDARTSWVSHSTRRKWFFSFPVDGNGFPTSDAAYRLIRYLFTNHHQAHLREALADRLLIHPELVSCMCRQLQIVDLVRQGPADSDEYRYALDSQNAELQRKVEVALLEYPARSRRLKKPPVPSW